jgi:hypothetical protein
MRKIMKNNIFLMLLLVISNVVYADISFTEQEIPKVIANNGYEFTVPYFELETPFGITAYKVKLIAPPGQLTFSVDLSTLQEVTLKPRVSITNENDANSKFGNGQSGEDNNHSIPPDKIVDGFTF